jgi:hypothetical protein
MIELVENSGRNGNAAVQPAQNADLVNQNEVVDRRGVCDNYHRRPNLRLSLSHSDLPESFAILLEIRNGVIVDFMLLKKGVRLHSRLETKEPSELRGCQDASPIPFDRQTLERGARQILPPRFQSFGDVLRQLESNLHACPSSFDYLIALAFGEVLAGEDDQLPAAEARLIGARPDVQ